MPAGVEVGSDSNPHVRLRSERAGKEEPTIISLIIRLALLNVSRLATKRLLTHRLVLLLSISTVPLSPYEVRRRRHEVIYRLHFESEVESR